MDSTRLYLGWSRPGFCTYQSAQQKPIHIFGRHLRVDYPQLKVKPQRIYQVFVENLPFTYETSLREVFEKFGEVWQDKIWYVPSPRCIRQQLLNYRSGYDANGRALPYPHVEFRTQEAAETAFEAS